MAASSLANQDNGIRFMTYFTRILSLSSVVLLMSACGGALEEIEPIVDQVVSELTPSAQQTANPEIPEPTNTPGPISSTPAPVNTPAPTNTAQPANTPEPSSVPSNSPSEEEQLDRSSWSLTGSTTQGLNNAIDGDNGSRWTTTGQTQEPGQYFQIDLGNEQSFTRIVLDSLASPNDEPASYAVFVSNDSSNFDSVIASGSGSPSGITEIVLSDVSARYIRIEQLGNKALNWWSIHEINIYVVSDGSLAPVPAPIPTAIPTAIPTLIPVPTPIPTVVPTSPPTIAPTPLPTPIPVPTTVPTPVPTSVPTLAPTPTPVTPTADLSKGKESYQAQCLGCHGVDGVTALFPFDVNNCIHTDCGSLESLALYISEDMPKGNAAACVLESDTDSCALNTAAYILNGFSDNQTAQPTPGETPTPVTSELIGIAKTPLARLTNDEFVSSLRALLNLSDDSENFNAALSALPPESNVAGLANDADTQGLTQLSISGFLNVSSAAAQDYLSGVDGVQALLDLMDCPGLAAKNGIEFGVDPFTRPDCFRFYSRDLLQKAYGRSLTDEDDALIADMLSVMDSSIANLGMDSSSVEAYALRITETIRFVSVSPEFLFFVERGAEPRDLDDADVAATYLSSEEIARRLAYFITGSIPDEALMADAQADLLTDPQKRLEHANRLMDGALATTQFVNAFRGWLGVVSTDTDDTDLQAINAFLADWFSNEKPFMDLYSSPVDVRTSDGGQIELDAGVLGLRAFVSSHTNFPTPAFIHRGEFVTDRLLCNKLPDDIPVEAGQAGEQTPLEVFENHNKQACATCHVVFDNYGVQFQQFDRETSFFDPSLKPFGEAFDLFSIGDVSGNLGGVDELGLALGSSYTAAACMAELVYRDSVRRSVDLDGADDFAIDTMVTLWQNAPQSSMKSLIRTIVTSENFVTLFH